MNRMRCSVPFVAARPASTEHGPALFPILELDETRSATRVAVQLDIRVVARPTDRAPPDASSYVPRGMSTRRSGPLGLPHYGTRVTIDAICAWPV
jgi:hypothetical protein